MLKSKQLTPLEKKAKIKSLNSERERILQRIKDIEYTLSTMPANTALGIWCMNAYLERAKRELSKVEKEIDCLSN